MDKPYPAYEGSEPYIFVSYAHVDSELVYPELIKLKNAGFNIWYDEGIAPGTSWRTELAEALAACSVFLFYITPQAARSQNCNKEVNFALSRDRHFLGVYLDETELPPGLEFSINDLQAIIKYQSDETTYRQKLNAALKSLLPEAVGLIDGHEVVEKIAEQDEYTTYLVRQKGVDRLAELTLISGGNEKLMEEEARLFAKADHGNFAVLYGGGTHQMNRYQLFNTRGIWDLDHLISGIQIQQNKKNFLFGNWFGVPLELSLDIIRQMTLVLQALDDEGLFISVFDPHAFSISENGRLVLHFPAVHGVSNNKEGELRYASPEQLYSDAVDIRSNIYSIGLIWYELLMGKLPIRDGILTRDERAAEIEENTSQLPTLLVGRGEISGTPGMSYADSKMKLLGEYNQFSRLLRRMLAPEPQDRFESTEDLLQTLEAIEYNPSNKSSNSYLTALYARMITTRRDQEDAVSLVRNSIALDAAAISRILGAYKNSNYGTVEFSLENGLVQFLHRDLSFGSEALPSSPCEWQLLQFTYSFRFELHDDGSVARLWVIHPNGYQVPLRPVA